MKTALVCGVTGQDGAYLSRLLLERGYRVLGTSRDAQVANLSGLRRLGLEGRVEVLSMSPTDFRSVLYTLEEAAPDEVYHLAGQSSVGISFHQPALTLESNAAGTLNLLEAIRFLGRPARFYLAASSECFGETPRPASEETPFRPRSPYAVAKAAAFWQVASYREAYGLHASSGILFNHESPLRPERFVTRKVVATACRIARGSPERLRLGNLDVRRDWGWAPEYVEAMWRMLQRDEPEDFVVASGETRSLEEFLAAAFAALDLDWREHVDRDPALLRPLDLRVSRADPSRARERLGWEARTRMQGVVEALVAAELERLPPAR